ncbi:hypothetical protein SBF1_5130006 [Candidatus Desulfosporosinus infrequens]|uniref:Uncharacterized protein n=1 Tax=Candidatus Desulfosporosinus infrequens TaxID=2043169 RepID=A0A2U3LI95_9FIRM|nr:hypothetical protein SBF1_5130006 [Candidatus Desulfosporosinus infrequens]
MYRQIISPVSPTAKSNQAGAPDGGLSEREYSLHVQWLQFYRYFP